MHRFFDSQDCSRREQVNSSLSKLIALGRIARIRIENLAKNEEGPEDLTGYCAVGSRYLERLSIENEVHPIFVVGLFKTYHRLTDQYILKSGHAWLEYDGNIVDITATQFKNSTSRVIRNFDKRVYTSVITNPHYEKQYVGFRAIEEAQNWYEEDIDWICDKAKNLQL